jgi:hypothetical protein
MSVTLTVGVAWLIVNVALAVPLVKSVLPEKLASTVYVPTVVGAPLKAALVAVVFPVKYVSVGATLSMLADVAVKAEPVYAPLASVTVKVGSDCVGLAWLIVNEALALALV